MKLIIALMLLASAFLLVADFTTIGLLKANKAVEVNVLEIALFHYFGYTLQPLVLSLILLGIGSVIYFAYSRAERQNAWDIKFIMILFVSALVMLFFFDMLNDVSISIGGTGLIWLITFAKFTI